MQTTREYRSPLPKLVRFFEKSRDGWKDKCRKLKQLTRSQDGRVRSLEHAAETGRAKAEAKAKKTGKPWTKKDDARALEEERDKVAKKYKEPVAPDSEDLTELPEGWCWAGTEQIAANEPYSLGIGPFGSNLKVSDYTDEGVPLIFVRHIRSEEFARKN